MEVEDCQIEPPGHQRPMGRIEIRHNRQLARLNVPLNQGSKSFDKKWMIVGEQNTQNSRLRLIRGSA
jgi:hypothetical protein